MTKLKIRLTLDFICWIGTTIALVWWNYPTMAALVGATGIMYLGWCVQEYFKFKKEFQNAERIINQLFDEYQEQLPKEDDQPSKEDDQV